RDFVPLPTRRSSDLVRRILATLAALAIAGVLASVGAVALLRYVDPPVTAMMLQQQIPVRSQAHVWVGRDAISQAAAHAVIAAEEDRKSTRLNSSHVK